MTQIKVDFRLTGTERLLLEELERLAEKRLLDEWAVKFVNSIYHLALTADAEEALYLSHKQRFYLWRLARDSYGLIQDTTLRQIIEQVLPVWESSYNVSRQAGKQ